MDSAKRDGYCYRLASSFADSHHINADLAPAVHIYADPDPAFILMRIRILLLIKVMGIYDHWSIDLPGLYFEPSGLHSERPRLYFQPLKRLNFAFNADPDPVFLSNADSDPDPASKK